MIPYTPTPVQEITNHPTLEKAGVRLLVKREDMNHPFVSGNKWWKLRYNLEEALGSGHKTILTFGGAFSNHIYAAAAAAKAAGLESIGIVRGEETLPLNPTLRAATENGMLIRYVGRADYRLKTSDVFIDKLRREFGNFFLIPEGGSNPLAVKGCAELADGVLSRIDFDYLFLPVGTGGTLAGIVCGMKGERKITGVSVLKGEGPLGDDIEKMATGFSGKSYDNWSLLSGYHHGGYAKTTPELLAFIEEMKNVYGIPLDHVYTAKLLWAVIQETEAGSFPRGSTVLGLHTGGLHG